MRRWLKLLLIFVVLVVVIGVASYVYLFQMHGLEDIVAGQLSSMISKTWPLRITVGHISGDYFESVVLEDVSVRHRDSTDSELFTAKRITLEYKLSNLINRSYLFRYVWLDSAHLMLTADSSGRILLPKAQTQTTSTGSKTPDVTIDKLLLAQCAVTITRPRDTLELFNIFWDGALKVEDGTLATDIRQASLSSNRKALQLSSLAGKITYADGRVTTQDLTINEKDGRIKVSGMYDLRARAGQLTFNADDADLKAISSAFGVNLSGTVDAYGNLNLTDNKVSGHVALGGRFLMADLENLAVDFRYDKGRLYLDTINGIALGSCTLNGHAEFNLGVKPEQYSASLDIANFNLKHLLPNTFTSDLTGHLDLSGSSFKNDSLRLRIATTLNESSFDDYPIQTGSGTMIITTRDISFPDSFFVSYFENEFAVSGTVQYSGEMDLAVRAQLANLDRYRGKLFLDQPGGRGYGEATITGPSKDPHLDGYFVSDSVWLYGMYADSCDVSFHVQRFLSAQRGSVEARFFSGTLWDVAYDTAYTVLGLDSDIVHIDTAFAIGPDMRAVGSGELQHLVYPQHLAIDTLELALLKQTLYNRGKIEIAIDSAGFDFQKAAIISGPTMLMALGRIDYDESMRLAVSANDIPVDNWLRLFRQDIPADGRASFRSDISGNFRNPVFTLDARLDSLTYDSLVLGDVNISGRYGQQVFTLDSLLLESHPGHYFASGMLNVEIDFTSDSLIMPLDQPLDISISAEDTRFDLVTLLLPNVEDLQGHFRADFRLFGTPDNPHLEGTATLDSARLKYFDLTNIILADSASVRMKDNQIIIDRIDAYVENPKAATGRSYAYIDGAITVKSLSVMNYDVDIDISKGFPVKYDLDDIDGIVEGWLHIEGDTPPTVSGDLTVTSARYLVNFASEEEGSPLMMLLSGDKSWDLNINVDVLSNYWIKNDDIDAEFSGQLNIIRDSGNYRFIGEMEILRGRGFLFDKTFQIDPGSRVIYNDIDTLNPTLDITAYTKIVGVSQYPDSSNEQIELGLHITGTLENPEFNTVGDGFSRSDILPLLVANYAASDSNQAGAMTKIEQRMTGLVSSQVSQLGTRQLSRLGVETFEIDPSYGGKLDPLRSKVTLGFYTSPNLYIYGRSQLSQKLGQEVGFEYRFNKSFMLEGLKDEEDLYHLNLKLKWEF